MVVPTDRLRRIRIWLLKVLHWPFVVCIISYEYGRQYLQQRLQARSIYVGSNINKSQRPPAILRRPVSTRSIRQDGPHSQYERVAAQQRQILDETPSDRQDAVSKLEQLAADLERQGIMVKELLDRERARQPTS